MNEQAPQSVSEFSLRLEEVTARIAVAAVKSRRTEKEVRLIGASKTVTPERLRMAYEAGLSVFGENRIQEGKIKVPAMPSACEWHFIGGLQTNKAKDAVRLFSWIQSVDRADLVSELEQRAAQSGARLKVLIEVNIAGESSKHGASPAEARTLVELANAQPHLEVHGFMTVAPFFEDLEKVRPFFVRMREVRDTIASDTGLHLPELSMGMSHDFETAIEEGATMVRVGTALFGARAKPAV